MQSELLSDGLPLYLAFLLSASAHEAAHAWSAQRGGDPTAYRGGQVSLDPRPHIRREPVGLLFLPILCLASWGWPMGFASAPYDPRWAQRFPHRAAWMALAGPAANLALLLCAGLLIHLGILSGGLAVPERLGFASLVAAASPGLWSVAAKLLSVFFSMNLVLFVLNLIPFPPLDGSAAIQLLMSKATALRYQAALRHPALGWVGLAVAWFLFPPLFRRVFAFALGLLYPGMV